MIDRTLAAIAANRATYFGMGGAALALAAALLSAGPSRADVITMTVKGFTGCGYLAGGTLVAQFTGTPETDGTYQQSDLTNATATYTVGAIKHREYSLPELIEFFYTSPTDFNYDFDSNSNGNYFAEGDAFVQDTTYYQALVDYNGAFSSSPYTVNGVPGSSISTASAPSQSRAPGSFLVLAQPESRSRAASARAEGPSCRSGRRLARLLRVEAA
jgi:hypothetical protein